MLSSTSKVALFCSLGSVLTGCGGGSGSSEPSTVPSPPSISGSPSLTAAQSLLDTHADPVAYTTLGSIPNSGNLTYEGYAYGTLANTSDAITDSLIGDLEVSVSLGSASTTFTGTIDNFVDSEGDTVTGSLDLTGGSFDRGGNANADPTVGISINGTLTDPQARTLAITGRLEGDFLGTNYDALGGELLATVTVGSENQNIDGGFIAER